MPLPISVTQLGRQEAQPVVIVDVNGDPIFTFGGGAGGGGDASAANQVTGNNTLTTISGKLPASLGPKTAAASMAVVLATDQPSAPLPAGTDRSGNIGTGGTAQVLAAANAARTSLVGQNISAGDLWINETGNAAAVDTAGSFKVVAGQAFAIGTNRAISIVGATTGQKFTATET